MGKIIDVDFSTALRMHRGVNATMPYVKNKYDPVLWHDQGIATLVSDVDNISGWGNATLNLIKYSRFANFSLIGKQYNVRDPYVSTAASRAVEEQSAAIWHEQPKSEWLMSPFSRNIAIVPFETTRVPPSWVPRINAFDAVLVPCEQNKQMMIDSDVTIPCDVIHWGVDGDKFYELKRRDDGIFTFGHMGALSLRKGTDILVKAFEAAFPPSVKDVRLICKTSGRGYPFMSKDKRVEVQMGPVSHDDLLNDFFSRIDCFVFPTKGEGFGLTPLEAMATGVPAIITAWSGPMEYLTDEVGWKLDYTMDEAREFSDKNTGVYKEDCGQWAIPSFNHLVHLMQYAYAHQDEVRAKGKVAAEYVRTEWTWNKQIYLFEKSLNKFL